MYSRRKMTRSIEPYSVSLERAREALAQADAVLVGVGSGLSASGGINYLDEELAKRWFPEYWALGYRCIAEIQSAVWRPNEDNLLYYWGYWAKHIQYIRYRSPVLPVYQDLYRLLEGKNYFLFTTNCDGQLKKAGFPEDRVFMPQGDYCYFQCEVPCRDDALFDNREMIDRMVAGIHDFKVREEDLPRCPYCGARLVPNLRFDQTYVEKPHLKLLPDLKRFLRKAKGKRLVLLELGVGFNTPVIIRWPFENIACTYPHATLIRGNLNHPEIPEELEDAGIAVEHDLAEFLFDLAHP